MTPQSPTSLTRCPCGPAVPQNAQLWESRSRSPLSPSRPLPLIPPCGAHLTRRAAAIQGRRVARGRADQLPIGPEARGGPAPARGANRVSPGGATRDPRAPLGRTGLLRHVGCGRSSEGQGRVAQGSAHAWGGGGRVPMDWERRLRARLAARRAREWPGMGSGRGKRPGVPAVTGGAGTRPAGRAPASPVLPCPACRRGRAGPAVRPADNPAVAGRAVVRSGEGGAAPAPSRSAIGGCGQHGQCCR